ncbi:MAG: DUF1836 domain-containing protein [Lachnospiraceae bacterium]|nr:DUF1836 domain-containing protein [Lachnospiraceae bacterium]
MDSFIASEFAKQMSTFYLPRYEELPGMGLYMEQIIIYLDDILTPLFGEKGEAFATPSMISNYIKYGVISRPVKKKYSREHMAYLIFIFTVKQSLSISDIRRLLEVQKATYPLDISYNYFCTELENILKTIFEESGPMKSTATKETEETKITRMAVATVAHKVYLNKYMEYIKSK